jgi:hypothetical protein
LPSGAPGRSSLITNSGTLVFIQAASQKLRAGAATTSGWAMVKSEPCPTIQSKNGRQIAPAAAPSMPLTEFDPTVRTLADLHDQLGALIAAVVASTGKKPPRLRRYPRPRTALDRRRERLRWTKHKALVRRLKPDPDDGRDRPALGSPVRRRSLQAPRH